MIIVPCPTHAPINVAALRTEVQIFLYTSSGHHAWAACDRHADKVLVSVVWSEPMPSQSRRQQLNAALTTWLMMQWWAQ